MKAKLLLLVPGLLLLVSALAGAQGTAFIYQGRLTSSGSPANGTYDFRFALSNAISGGNHVVRHHSVNTTDQNEFLVSGVSDFCGVDARTAGRQRPHKNHP